jgi:predicted ferric reductase
MDSRRVVMILGAFMALCAFTAFSFLIRDTYAIWLQNRALALLAYQFLFTSIVLGEVRMLTRGKMDFSAFRYHTPISAFSVVLVLAHFISSVVDNYKWGKQLSLIQYLGFSFQDKWLAALSFGTIAFYLMALIAATSPLKGINPKGFRGWRIFHYLSYIAFFMGYVHTVNLGTDFKTSILHTVLKPMVVFSLILVFVLLITRIINGLRRFHDITETTITAIFIISILVTSTLLIQQMIRNQDETTAVENSLAKLDETLNQQETDLALMRNDTTQLMTLLEGKNE